MTSPMAISRGRVASCSTKGRSGGPTCDNLEKIFGNPETSGCRRFPATSLLRNGTRRAASGTIGLLDLLRSGITSNPLADFLQRAVGCSGRYRNARERPWLAMRGASRACPHALLVFETLTRARRSTSTPGQDNHEHLLFKNNRKPIRNPYPCVPLAPTAATAA